MRTLLLCLLGGLTLSLGGCASTDSTDPTTEHATSSIPWNRPESWEGSGGMFGGFQPQN